MLIITRLHHHFRNRIVEWGLGYILTSWGLILLLTPGAFAAGDNPSYYGWSQLAEQNVWGVGALVVGLLRLAALYVNGAHSKSPMVRTITGFGSMFIWFWVTDGLLHSPVMTTGLAVYPWLMLGDAYSVYQAAGDAYQARFKAKADGGSSGYVRRH